MEDPFKNLRPAEPVQVAVGASATLTLREANLVQQQRLMAEVQKLDNLGGVLTQFATVLGDEESTTSLTERLVAVAPQLWKDLRKLLGSEFIPAVTGVCRIMLNTRENMEQYGYDDALAEKDVFIRSPKLDAKLQSDLTLIQATSLMADVWKINRYAESLGNLFPLATLMGAGQGEQAETETETQETP